jgi:hypothetical protein
VAIKEVLDSTSYFHEELGTERLQLCAIACT